MYRIRNLREDSNLSQRQMADFLNISQSTYSRYERGDLDIPTVSLIALSKFYKISVDYLLDLTDECKPYAPKQKRK